MLEAEAAARDESLARKLRSIKRLKSEAVPVNEHLPAIEAESETTRRNDLEVALRAMALCAVALKGEGLESSRVDKIVQKFAIESALTPRERQFISDPNPSIDDRTQFIWRYECYWVMLWALRFVDELDRPEHICNVHQAVAILHEVGREGFSKKASLRPQAEILDEADLVYRYHWAVVDARINGRAAPAGLDGGVVMERHYALNWLIGYMDQAWDDISTDT